MRSKVYSARVIIQSIVETHVIADDDVQASTRAREQILERFPFARIQRIEVVPAAELDLFIGQRVLHREHGPGKVVEIGPKTVASAAIELVATIQFDAGMTISTILPVLPDELQLLTKPQDAK